MSGRGFGGGAGGVCVCAGSMQGYHAGQWHVGCGAVITACWDERGYLCGVGYSVCFGDCIWLRGLQFCGCGCGCGIFAGGELLPLFVCVVVGGGTCTLFSL